MSLIAPVHRCLILDACCVINLYASGHISSILVSIDRPVAVAIYVHDVEARRIKGRIVDGKRASEEAIDLRTLIDAGLLRIVDAETSEEQRSYVEFAAGIGDDGEAVTGAIALHRGWAMAIDDRAARGYLNRVAPSVQLVSTPEILKFWAEKASVPAQVLQAALGDICVRANYKPPRDHPLYEWWCVHQTPH